MFYYIKNEDIVAKSPIQIIVQDAIEVQNSKDYEPSDYKYSNAKFVKRNESLNTVEITKVMPTLNEETAFLNRTDFKVIKYRDQKDLGIETDLTEEEYIALLRQRQTAREALQG